MISFCARKAETQNSEVWFHYFLGIKVILKRFILHKFKLSSAVTAGHLLL